MKTTTRSLFLANFNRHFGVCSVPLAAFMSACLALMPQHGYALPAGGQLVAGQVTSTFNGSQLTLDQTSRTAIMNWQSFNLAPTEVVRILQGSPDAAMLARVTGGNPTELLGRLQANGKLFLINPKGILVGQGAVIDTAAFLASTLDVADADFLKQGALTLKGDSAAGVVNLGKITAREGNVLLLAHTVKNAGEISAAKGTAGLGAGTEVYLAAPDAPMFLIRTNLPATVEKTGVDNGGVVSAAQAQLEAAGGSIYDLAVNHSGVIRATGVERRPDGRVFITTAGGNVQVSGSATARNADGSGGQILVGGGYQGKNPAIANAANTRIAASASLETGDATAAGGQVVVWADGHTRFDGRIATGRGGDVEVSGKRSLGLAGQVDTRGGTLLLDPDDITIVAGSGSVPSGLADRNWLTSEDTGSQNLGADTLTGLLAVGSVSLQATNTLTVSSPVIVAAGGTAGVALTLTAPTITLNQSVSLANVTNGELNLHGPGGTSLTSAVGAALNASKIFINGFPNVALNGTVTTADLGYAKLGGPASSFSATNPGNAISQFILNSDPGEPLAVNFTGNLAVHSSTAMQAAVKISSATNVTLSSAGNLTLRDEGAAVTGITASGVTKLASTGGVLINQSGAALLAGAGRRLLYTANTSGAFSLGGLSGYTQVDGVSYANDPNSGVTLVLYNAAGGGPVLTLTITANDFIRLYGQADPTFTASYAGGTAANLTTLPSFSIQQGAHVNTGTYTIVPSGAASSSHSLSYVNGTLQINSAALTYVANAAARPYADANPIFGGTVTGFVGGDTLASATTGTLVFTSSASAGSNVGSYGILGSGLTANSGNYVFQNASANYSALTVNPAPLTLVGTNYSSRYGDSHPLGFTVEGLRNGDSASVLLGTYFDTAFPATTNAGSYTYGFTNYGTATNYEVTGFRPGTLTIAPAPVVIVGNAYTTAFGEPLPTLGYTVTGLRNGDTASVLSGVTVSTSFFGNPAPGNYTFNLTSTGTAQNYQVTAVTPGTLTVNRRPITVTANDVSVYAGIVPGFTATATGNPVLTSGPQFTLSATTSATANSPAGTYVITPVIVPGSSTTLAQVQSFYDFTFNPGTLTLTEPPVEPTVTLSFTPPELKVDANKLVKTEPTQTKVEVGIAGPIETPLTPAQFNTALRDFTPELLAGAKDMLASKQYMDSLSREEDKAALKRFAAGEIGADDPSLREVLYPFMAKAAMDAITSGRELTFAQKLFVGRLAGNVNKQRQMLAEELQTQYMAFQEEKAKVSVNNPYALKTMPDIVITAQQAATERMIAASVGAAAGAALGAAGLAALTVSSVQTAVFGAVKVAALYGTGTIATKSAAGAAASAGAATSAGGAAFAIGVAVAVVVVGVVSVVMIAQEQKNVDAYNAALDRAKGPAANKDLSNLNLKSNDLDKAEFLTAFMATMLESTPPKK